MAQKQKQKKRQGLKTKAAGNRVFLGILVALAVLAVSLFLFFRLDSGTTSAENALGTFFSPIQNGAISVSTFFRNTVNGVRDYRNMSAQNEAYRREIDQLKLEVDSLEEAQIENERLKVMLDVKERNASQNPIFAKVIARDPGAWFDTFSINRGTADGINVNMAVVTGDGLVGRIIEAGLTYSKVLCIIDSRSSVSCQIERTRLEGVMKGMDNTSLTEAECKMYYISSIDVVPGDKVLTSGVDRIFPKGLTVGTVLAVSRLIDTANQYIVVVPDVDFRHIEEVIVLRTLVEAEDASLPSVPTASPRPTVNYTPAPSPTPNPNENLIDDENANWSRPTVMPNVGAAAPDNMPTNTTQPTEKPNYETPEDEWAGN